MRDYEGLDAAPAARSGLLAHRPFVVLFFARTLAMMGLAFAPVALAFGILDLPFGDAHLLSVMLTSQIGPKVLLILFGGVVADRYPRARVLQLGLALSAAGWVTIGVMLLLGGVWLPLMCLAAALTGVAEAIAAPTLTGIVPEVVPPLLFQPGNAWLSMGSASARLVGLVASGAVVVLLGGGWAVITAGALYLVAGAVALWLPVHPGGADRRQSPLRQLKEGWGEFSSRQWLWVCTVQYTFVVMMLMGAHGVLGPVVAKAELGGAKAWTMILAGEAVGAIAGTITTLVWRPRRPILVGVTLTFLAGLPAILLGVSAPLATIIAAAFGMGFAFQLFGVVWLTALQTEIPPAALSRVAAYDAFGSTMFGPIGLVIAAPAADVFGIHAALVACGVIVLAVTALALCAPGVWKLKARTAR
jgi:MFS family permease